MSLRINQNIEALNSYRNLSVTQGQMAKSLEKLSSGFRINRAADDAAGLAISEGLRSQVGGLKVAVRNAQDGTSVAQTADGALNETTAILQRMRDLAVQASNSGSVDPNGQSASNAEFGELQDELDRIQSTTSFGSQKLLDGSYNGTFQVGANNTAADRISIDLTGGTGNTIDTVATAGGATAGSITDLDSTGLGLAKGTVGIDTTGGAQNAIDALDNAIKGVSAVRANIGAKQNRLEHTINNLNVAVENTTASESRIRDTDMASEMMSFTRAQVLSQAGTAMLAQANQAPQGVLQLLR